MQPASYRNNRPLPSTFPWRTSRGGGVGTMATFYAKPRAPTVVKDKENSKQTLRFLIQWKQSLERRSLPGQAAGATPKGGDAR